MVEAGVFPLGEGGKVVGGCEEEVGAVRAVVGEHPGIVVSG